MANTISSLWGESFEIPSTKETFEKIKQKLEGNSPQKKSGNLSATIVSIEEEVNRVLGKFKKNTLVVKDKETLNDYLKIAKDKNILALDTETNNSLDPVTCKLMGLCLYTPGEKNVYVPVNHINPYTRERLDWQVSEEEIKESLSICDNTPMVMHNGKFDCQVIKCTTGKDIDVYWDTMIASRLLNENEKSAGLKQQYKDKIDPTMDKYDIEHLFKGLEYAIFSPEIFALYSATDPYMTYKLYEYQKEIMDRPDMSRIKNLFFTVEMPIVKVASDMEMTGTNIDTEYAKRLSEKYHKKINDIQNKIDVQLQEYSSIIANWRLTEDATKREKKVSKTGVVSYSKSKSDKLKSPPDIASPTQLSILLYDVLGVKTVDDKNPRGTGEDILKKIDNPLCELILDYRGVEKLLNTYIDKLVNCVNPKDHRLHAHFNQLGTDTGRFSSSDPNLQNIPSHEKSIRMMFRASDGCVLVGSDFSQQEPRLLAGYSQDENMINAYKQGKDLYATIASEIYHNDYRDNLEFATNDDGSWKLDANGERIGYPSGEKRRKAVKSLMLGIMYGMGADSLSVSIGCSVDEAQKIIDDFYKQFPKVKNWIESTYKFAEKNGYVEDFWGRRRRLPDIKLDPIEVIEKGAKSGIMFNPILGCADKNCEDSKKVLFYKELSKKCRGRNDIEELKRKAEADGIIIKDNRGIIGRAKRQCVNARVQGGASTMSKKAMIAVHNDELLNKWGFKLMIAVHDELIGECPKEYANQVADRLTSIMKVAALPECSVPFKCDPSVEEAWYESNYSDMVLKDYKTLLESNNKDTAIQKLCDLYSESNPDTIKNIIKE